MDPDGPSTVFVTIDGAGWATHLARPEDVCRRAVAAALGAAPAASSLGAVEVGVLLTDDARVRQLNATYRHRDRPTNVLSFPALDHNPDGPLRAGREPLPLGDVVLALETVRAEAATLGTPLSDHVTHLVIHGCLHLLGYDHLADGEAARMEGLETRILAGLGIADPYGSDPYGPDSDAGSSAAGVDEPVLEAGR